MNDLTFDKIMELVSPPILKRITKIWVSEHDPTDTEGFEPCKFVEIGTPIQYADNDTIKQQCKEYCEMIKDTHVNAPLLQVDQDGRIMISEKQVDDIVARVVAASSPLEDLITAMTEEPDRFPEVWERVAGGKQPLFKELSERQMSDDKRQMSRNYKVYLCNPTSDEIVNVLSKASVDLSSVDEADYVLLTVTSSTTLDEIHAAARLHDEKLVVYCPIPLSYWYLFGELSIDDTRLLANKEELVALFD